MPLFGKKPAWLAEKSKSIVEINPWSPWLLKGMVSGENSPTRKIENLVWTYITVEHKHRKKGPNGRGDVGMKRACAA